MKTAVSQAAPYEPTARGLTAVYRRLYLLGVEAERRQRLAQQAEERRPETEGGEDGHGGVENLGGAE